jgi:hypothetical protein
MFSDAKTFFNECLQIQITIYGQNHPFVAKVNNFLGVPYLLLDSSEDGLTAFHDRNSIQRLHLDKEKNNLTTSGDLIRNELELSDTLCNIGSLYLDWSERKSKGTEKRNIFMKQAVSCFQDAINIRKKNLGECHFLVVGAQKAEMASCEKLETPYLARISPLSRP